jgi:hypothetical protein
MKTTITTSRNREYREISKKIFMVFLTVKQIKLFSPNNPLAKRPTNLLISAHNQEIKIKIP